MRYKYIVLISLLFLINGCERGVGEEPIIVNDVNDNNLTGTWILSERYTDKKYLKYLKIQKVDDYYFTIKNNTELDYHSFNPRNNRKILEAKGIWSFIDNRLIFKKNDFIGGYIGANGRWANEKYRHELKKPIRKNKSKAIREFKRFRITKKNNKLLLWHYKGDPDARRYIMYEKKDKRGQINGDRLN